MEKKTILITGSSRGIGKSTALRFAREGHHILINCRKSADELSSVKEEILANTSAACEQYLADVSDPEQVNKLFDKIGTQEIDVLVNNAGISHLGLLQDLEFEMWNQIINTNLTSAFLCSQKVIPGMVQRKKGKIINISSIWGNIGASCEAAYSASKGGLNSLTKALAKELAPSNIQVNAVACGAIETEMNGFLSEQEKLELSEEIPAGRFGSPEEVAELIFQLASGNDYITGQIITIDGGWI